MTGGCRLQERLLFSDGVRDGRGRENGCWGQRVFLAQQDDLAATDGAATAFLIKRSRYYNGKQLYEKALTTRR